MKRFKRLGIVYLVAQLCFLAFSCGQRNEGENSNIQDSLAISKMILERERAMIDRNLETVIAQFDEDATWINSQGYYFEGRTEIKKFHSMLNGNDSLDYYYEAGIPRVRVINQSTALAYYSWKMFWYKKQVPTDTTYKEIGLMSLTAKKVNGTWKWIAVTNQHTPWFYDSIDRVRID